ncbi:MAG: hypothetical protein GXY83_00040 [Rhodopirellula sp.]|nr:hypothetical protein [Rhodopirellula sp.]
MAFSEGGISLPTDGLLTAANGSIALQCYVPEDWLAKEDRTLFHLIAHPHAHVTLFFRDGLLTAVYKGGKDDFASLRSKQTVQWEPGRWHRVQFSWQAANSNEVDFLLTVDGELIGVAVGRILPDWPQHCEVAARNGGSPWKGLLRNIVVSSEPIAPPDLVPGKRSITIYVDKTHPSHITLPVIPSVQ